MGKRISGFSVLIVLAASLAVAQPPAFDVVSVKHSPPGKTGGQYRFLPGGRLSIENGPLDFLIEDLYGLHDYQLVGPPAMMAIVADGNSARYDIEATAADKSATKDRMKEMLRTLLADRFQLKVHRETRDLPVYALAPAKGGIKVSAADPNGKTLGTMPITRGWMEGKNISMPVFISTLSRSVDRPIIDKTGYTNGFNYRLTWTPDGPAAEAGDGAAGSCPASWEALQQRFAGPLGPGPAPVNCHSLFTAIQEQMGLKLDPQKAPIEVLVIDHVEKPSEN